MDVLSPETGLTYHPTNDVRVVRPETLMHLPTPVPRAALALSVLLSTTAFADDPEELLVTASRQPETISEALASASIFNREDIERSQAQSLPELLSLAPGVNIASTGGRGGLASVFMRGTNANQVLVLIDGIKASSPSSGLSQLQYLPLEQIERIEMVRGPRSSLYGSEAIGGVIQIFTRKGETGFHPRAMLGAGSYDSYQGSLGLAGGSGQGWFNLQIDGETSKGFDACNNRNPFCGNEPDRDAFDNKALGLNLGYRLNDRAEVGLILQNSSGTSENDSTWSNKSEYQLQTLGLNARLQATDAWSISLNAGQYLDNADNFLDSLFMDYLNTSRTSLSLQNDFKLPKNQTLTLGLDRQWDEVDATTNYSRSHNQNTGLFGQWRASLGQHELQLGLRRDDNAQFGQHDTGNLAWGYGFANGLHAFASYGTAFAAPTFNDLYYPFGMGNPNLKPTRSKSLELGLKGTTGPLAWRSSLYQTRIDDLIAWNSTRFTTENIDKARIQGLELGLDTQLLGWQLAASLDLIDPKNHSAGPNHGKQLARRPEQTFTLSLDRDFGRYSLGATLLAESQRFDDPANKVKLDAFAKLDLRAEYRFDRNWRLQAKLDNLFDERYQTAKDFNLPGRSAFVTLRYALQ